MQVQNNLSVINTISETKQTENELFMEKLRQIDSYKLDSIVHKLNDEITPQINCLDCGNCCKSLMINVEEKEADDVAEYLKITREEFDENYVEKGESGAMIINKIPCHFLQSDNCCLVYEKRFDGCREFPALHLPNFNKRLFTVFMHYNRCPIIFNVVERLKEIDL